MGGGGGGGSGSTVIDPPIGALFKDPPEIFYVSKRDGLVEVNLEAIRIPVDVNGKTANLFTYNKSFPGPTIRVHRGDRLKINFKNSLPMKGDSKK
jgi:FtsP/CotA-like multicopper oxidase with cupredoxin domain